MSREIEQRIEIQGDERTSPMLIMLYLIINKIVWCSQPALPAV